MKKTVLKSVKKINRKPLKHAKKFYGAVLENTFYDEPSKEVVRRYWLSTKR